MPALCARAAGPARPIEARSRRAIGAATADILVAQSTFVGLERN